MKKLLLVFGLIAIGTVAWAQPTSPEPSPPAPGTTERGAPTGSATPPAGGSGSAPSGQAVPPSTSAPADSSATITGTPTTAAPAAPAAENVIVPGAIETKTGECANLRAKPWYDQLACRHHQDHEGNYWLPKGVNRWADSVDSMYIATVALSAFFFFGITAVVVLFCWKYRGRPGHRAEPSPSHNDAMEITWTVIPTIIVVFLFYYGWRGYIFMMTPPVKAVEVQVLAQKWQWSFTHSNGTSDSNLHVPVGTPVRLVMTAKDVLHSFYVPSLRAKQDLVPRRYTYMWFEATKPGTYRLYCTEFCGRDHSQMKVKVVVHDPGGYERYLAEKAEADQSRPLPELGADLYQKKGCVTCHSIDGSPRVGPSFKGSFGTTIPLAAGGNTKIDENYVKESILAPQAKGRPGFPPSMPSFEGQLKERQVEALICFVKAQNPAGPQCESAPAKK